MPLTLYVDGPRWRAHQQRVLAAHPRIVPVLKANGYGFGLSRLAEQAAALGVDTVAVGMYHEIAQVAAGFSEPTGGSVLVMSPWRPFETGAVLAPHVVHTVGRLSDLAALAALGSDGPDAARPRVVLERLTSMRRHGFSARDLRESAGLLERVTVEGVAVHLPLAGGSHLEEVQRLMTDVVAAGLPTRRVFVSHLREAELDSLRQGYPDYDFRPRIGTELWLGDREAMRVCATVLDTHPVRRGDVFGYRARSAPVAGTIVVVSGGTSHGIALEAPTGGSTLRERAVRLAQGGLDAAGLVRSPYTIGGRLRMFAEPPHMQVSMLFLSHGTPVPPVGDEVAVRMRLTTAGFDRTVVSG